MPSLQSLPADAARVPDLDFRAVFEATPGILLLLAPDAPRYTMLAASDERLAATLSTREETIGRGVFEVFTDDPENLEATGVRNLRASLETVLRTRAPHRMAVQQRYDLRRPDGTFEERYWAPLNVPVLGADGEVRYIIHHVEDVTERVASREAATAAEHRATRVLEQMSDAHAQMDREFRFHYINPAAERALGKTRDQLLGRTQWEAFPASVGSELERQYRQVQAEGVEAHFTHHYVGEGYDRHLEIDAYPTDEGGVALFWRDVTDRRRAEIGNAYLAAVVGSSGEAVVGLTPDGTVESWNPAAERLFGYTADEMIGQSIARLAAPDKSAEQEEIMAALRAGRTVSRETVRVTKDGRAVDVILTAAPVVDSASRLVGISATLVDITDRKQAETALRESEARYRTLFESIDEGFCVIEVLFDEHDTPVDYSFLETNPAFVKQTGLQDAVGKRIRELAPTHEAHWFEIYGKVAVTGEPIRFQNRAAALQRWYDVFAFRIGPPAGRRVAVLFNDVTAARIAERERERLLAAERTARAEAEAANRAKSDFLAVMSHELRTPLNAIGGYAELLEMGVRGPVTAQQREDLYRIQKSQQHLLGLINEVLNYAKLETGAVRYQITALPIEEALAAVEPLIAPQLHAKGLAYTKRVCKEEPAGAPIVVRADREKLQQVLLNLLSNAVKFTRGGGRVDISCEARERDVAIRVRDTGRGIPADKLEHIFEPFVQVDARLTRTEEGTGLGLAISRDLARGMGGDLAVESQAGVGSTFTLTLPIA